MPHLISVGKNISPVLSVPLRLRRMLRSRGDTKRWHKGEAMMPSTVRRDSINPWHDMPRSPLICSCNEQWSEKMLHTTLRGDALSVGESTTGWLSQCTGMAASVVSRVMSSSVLPSAANAAPGAE